MRGPFSWPAYGSRCERSTANSDLASHLVLGTRVLRGAQSKGASYGDEERCRPWHDALAGGDSDLTSLAQQTQDLRSRDARRDLVHGNKAHCQVGAENENRRLGNASLFAGIVDTPLPHHAAPAVRQNKERKSPFAPHPLGFLRRVHGNRHQVRARGAQRFVGIAVFRQLAEAEGSPVPPIEEQHQRPGACQLGKTAFLTRSVREHEIRCLLLGLRKFPWG